MNPELEIQEIIKKNLPQQVGEVLKVRLEQAEKDTKKVIELESEIANLKELIKSLTNELANYVKYNERNSKLDEREVFLDKRQHDLDLQILQNKFESEKEKTEFAKSVALGLVRNTEYRKSIFGSENQDGYYSGDQWIQPTPVNKNLEEIKKLE